MEIQITQQQCGGTVFTARPHRLHLGGQNATGVDRLHFALPDAWHGCTTVLCLLRADGSRPAPIALDENGSVAVDRRLTGSTSGQWMLSAVDGSGYAAYTRPGSYDTYATLPTDGSDEDPSPPLYEQFVAQVTGHAAAAASAAQNAAASAADCAENAAKASDAAQTAAAAGTAAESDAQRARADADRAEAAADRAGEAAAGADALYAPKTHQHAAATQSEAGFMSAADKKKLDSLSAGTAAGITATTGNSYVRFSNGVQFCWGHSNAEGGSSVALPAPFANTAYAVLMTLTDPGGEERSLLPECKTSAAFIPDGSGSFAYLAVGRWK